MLSWLAYMKHGEPRERILRVRMPKPNLKPDFEQQASSFVDRIVTQVGEHRARDAAPRTDARRRKTG